MDQGQGRARIVKKIKQEKGNYEIRLGRRQSLSQVE
jgi:hypothetical protein